MSTNLQRLLTIMQRLRAPGGCPWDREQTAATIAPHTIEEAYEVADAVERADAQALCDELGDLLFQVVFQAQIASEQGLFDFDGVAAAICRKLIRRHPTLVLEPPATTALPSAGPTPLTASQQVAIWEDIKAAERREHAAVRRDALPAGHLDDVPRALPALMRAHKLSKRAARVGFDFVTAGDAADKVAEELTEIRALLAANATPAQPGPSARVIEELGDLLFAATNLARKLEVDAEAALRAANAKFERRFRGMEALAAERGTPFESLGLVAQERLWQEMKRSE